MRARAAVGRSLVMCGLAMGGLAVGALVGCRAPTSERCRDVCSRAADCVTVRENNQAFDEAECVATCAALERDVQGKAAVDKHAECMKGAKDCAAIRACM